ncbi:GerMN domain-containing protein [Alkalihalobacillus deserti]|uniref:GerMN domain-containing protein n=1 Tax=Alkalihalobacillus deserti TaxID=2879466 RepID=UPI001D14C502|nr:GerMN domain-containing protein [Alkalihalobacillus deserti]
MKRQSMFLLLGLLILLLSACGQGSTSNGNDQKVDSVETEQSSDATEQSSDATEDTVDTEVEETDIETAETDTEADQSEVEPTTTTVKLIFSDDDVMDMYLVDSEINATGDAVYKATLEAWIAGPTKQGLTSLISTDVEVQSVEIIDGVAHVSFSETLLDTQVGSGTEYMLLQQIAMAMKQFGFNETQILINGEVYPELFGHVDTSEPVVAEPLENYKDFN